MRTRDEFAAKQKERVKEKTKEVASSRELKVMIRDAVHLEHVTNDEHWDRYLSLITAGAEATRTAIDNAKRVLEDPRVVSHEDMLAAKMELRGYEQMLNALDWVLELPVAIMRTGDQARELFKEEE